jgi:hypothetical protein
MMTDSETKPREPATALAVRPSEMSNFEVDVTSISNPAREKRPM